VNFCLIFKANIFTSSRRRKLELFKNFTKKIVVLVQDNETYKERIKVSEAEDNGREIPINLINDMKGIIDIVFRFFNEYRFFQL
jgi:hypothetical protein